MFQVQKIKLFASILLFAGWWSACSTTEEASAPEENVANDSNIAANDTEIASEGNENEVLADDEANSFEDGDNADFASENGVSNMNFSDAGTSGSADEGDLFAEALAAEEAANQSSSSPPASSSNQIVDPTLGAPAFSAESMASDPTASDPLLTGEPLDAASPNMAAMAAEASAATNITSENLSTNLTPVGEGSNMVPPPLQETAPMSAPLVQAAEPSPPATDAAELEAAMTLISWVGYRINEEGRQLRVEIFSEGRPEFEVYEESNRAQQLEVVVRFYQSKLRRKIRWSIDSSEFRSPVAFVRMREFPERGIVDVVLTHRDRILPQFFSGNGRLMFVYTIPEHYFDKAKPLARHVKDRAQSLVLNEARPLIKTSPSSEGVQSIGYHRPDSLKKSIDMAKPIREFIRSQSREKIDPFGLPESFDRRREKAVQDSRTSWRWVRFGLMQVAQDDLEIDAENEEEVTTNENEEIPEENVALNEQGNGSENGNSEEGTETEEAIPVETITEEASEDFEDAGALDNTDATLNTETANAPNQAAPENTANANNANQLELTNPEQAPADFLEEPIANSPPATQNFDAELPTVEQAQESPLPAPQDIVGQANAGPAEPQYNGKPIFMEFYEAPLSLVLKSFSDETGNNFVFPSTIGQTPVTVHFKGVPWDEALKAILETHSLGLVRIGQNVVRVDQIGNLTNYMAALEQAKQLETRRLPTKVLIFRLNNAVAKDILTRVTTLLARDIELDPRIKVSDDERTNTMVMEAPAHVLAKAKNIIERLDLETPQVEIASRIVEVQKSQNNFFGFSWGNNFNFDPGRALGFGTLNFPNSLGSNFAVDPGVSDQQTSGVGRFRFGSLNKFVDLDLLLKLEEQKGTTNVLQSNRVLVLDGRRAMVLAGNSKFFRPAGGGLTLPAPGGGGGGAGGEAGEGLAEVKFNLSLEVTPQVTAMGSVIMDLKITSDTPATPDGQALADKNTRELETQMVRASGDTGVIGGIYDTTRVTSVKGVPFLSSIPIIGALFRSSLVSDKQTELLIMVTPNIVSGQTKESALADEEAAKTREANKQVQAPKPRSKPDKSIF